MKKDFTQIAIVLDRSGSMGSIEGSTIAGFNEFLKQQQLVPGTASVYSAKFDTEYEVLFDGDLKQHPELSRENFQPRGATALHDAIGKTINHVGKRLADLAEDQRPEKVVFVIMTDGLENSSREFAGEKIAQMIQHQKDSYKWEFVYLGANQDAVLVGERLGIGGRNSITYTAAPHTTRSVVASMSANMASYRQGATATMDFADHQRMAAIDDEEEKKKAKR